MASDDSAVSRRRIDYGVQRGLPLYRRVAGSRPEVRRVDPRFSTIHDFGDFAFVILFSVVMVTSVITENGPAGLLAAYTLFMFSPVLAAHEQITPAFSRELYRQIFRWLYWVVPKSAETIGAMRRLIMEQPLNLHTVITTSLAFALVCYVGTMVYFTRKDY